MTGVDFLQKKYASEKEDEFVFFKKSLALEADGF